MKLAFLVWLQLPTTNGAKQLYMNHLRPFFMRHQARLDHITGWFYSEAGKFISAHEAEFQFLKTVMMKILTSVKQLVNGSNQPATTQEGRGNTVPRDQVESSSSVDATHGAAANTDDDDDDDDDEYVSVSPSS
ncbi:hypothetical protein HanHA300_Chr03g0091961 [Helianthus annuus]|nr:hypothetical protein HanHA300_Chr03g0091961 [Helianthus annuus]KAJ0768061.1 hypothetical protein HanLR1_Chr03g0097081 [Helianthus annuus]